MEGPTSIKIISRPMADGLSSKVFAWDLHRTNPPFLWPHRGEPRTIFRASVSRFASPTTNTGMTNRAGLPMGSPYISFLSAGGTTMFSARISTRLQANRSATPSKSLTSTIPASWSTPRWPTSAFRSPKIGLCSRCPIAPEASGSSTTLIAD